MAQISFALFAASEAGFSIQTMAQTLELPEQFIRERIEAARLCVVMDSAFANA